jgi:hypothetical protein
MTGILQSLKLDAWYMVLVYLGTLLLILSFFYPVQGITNMQLILFSCGILSFGLGEWHSHKDIVGIKPPNIYTGPVAVVKGKIKKHDKISSILEIIGIMLIISTIIDILIPIL